MTETRRVLFVIQTPEFGGAENHLLDLVVRMPESVECIILALSEDFYTSRLGERPNVRVVGGPSTQRRSLFSLWKQFTDLRPDVIVLVKGVFDHYRLGAYVVARLTSARRLMVIEHLIPDPAPERVEGGGPKHLVRRLVGWRSRYMLRLKLQSRLAHATICVSDAIRRRLVHEYGYLERNTVTVRNGIDLRRYVPHGGTGETAASAREIQLVCVARLSHVKRIDVLLRALATVVQSQQNWRCWILGSGPMEQELRDLVRQLKLDAYVAMLGQQPDVRSYLHRADLFVLSSEKEGLPLALLEAMACGIPAVVSEVGGTGEVVVHGETGLLVKVGVVEDLAQAIVHLLVHAQERLKMGQAARRRIEEHFDIERSMEKLKGLILSY
ncbi:hypothetical protein YTPLAS18_24310 [Nitrospira sp.]|nr:hypothetical protein YTPLAS18_24310 [Nitrospira sp.]